MSTESVIVIHSKEHLEQRMADELPFILYFSSEDCNVCQSVFPKLINIINAYSIKVAKVDVAKHREIAGQLLIFTLPTILIMYEGREILRESRFIDFQRVERALSLLL